MHQMFMAKRSLFYLPLLLSVVVCCTRMPQNTQECFFYPYTQDKKTGFDSMTREGVSVGSNYCWGRIYIKSNGDKQVAASPVKIRVKGTKIWTYTGAENSDKGCYRILLPDSLQDRKITLIFTLDEVPLWSKADTQIVTTKRRHIAVVMKSEAILLPKQSKHQQFPD